MAIRVMMCLRRSAPRLIRTRVQAFMVLLSSCCGSVGSCDEGKPKWLGVGLWMPEMSGEVGFSLSRWRASVMLSSAVLARIEICPSLMVRAIFIVVFPY